MKKYQWSYEQFNWKDLTPQNRQLLETIELDFLPLQRSLLNLEESIDLSNDVIHRIFKGSEELSREKRLRTGFGKSINLPRDAIVKVNSIVSSLGKRLQDSTPIKAFDNKFDQAKDRIKSSLSKIKGGQKLLSFVEVLGNAAKEHPVWQAAIIGTLVAISTLAAGPGGALIVGPLLKGSVELIKGEKFSTAVGKGLYAGALGYLGATIASALMHWFEGIRIATISPVGPKDLGFEKLKLIHGNITKYVNGMQWTEHFEFSNVTVDPSMKSALSDTVLRLGGGDFTAYDDLLRLARQVASPEYLSSLKAQIAQAATDATTASADKIANDGFLQSIRDIGKYVIAASAGVASQLGDIKDKNSNPSLTTSDGTPIVPNELTNKNSDRGPESQPISMTSNKLTPLIQLAHEKLDTGNMSDDAKNRLLQKSVEARTKIRNKRLPNPSDSKNIKSLTDLIDKLREGTSGATTTSGKISNRPAPGPISMPSRGPSSSPFEGKKLTLPIMEGLWSDLTLQFGAGKLMKSWIEIGKPTNSTDIARMLADMGMEADDIRQVMLKAGISEQDMEETMSELKGDSDDSELELPFISGIEKFDKEAKRIFKNKGKDGFVQYWNKKVEELEKELKDKEIPSDDTNTGPEAEVIQAITNNDPTKAKEELQNILFAKKTISPEKQKRIDDLLSSSNISAEKRAEIKAVLDRSTVAEMKIFNRISNILKEHEITWKQLGIQKIILERRTNSVIML